MVNIVIAPVCLLPSDRLSVSPSVPYVDNTTVVTLFPLHLWLHCKVIEPFCGWITHPNLVFLSSTILCAVLFDPTLSLIPVLLKIFISFQQSTIFENSEILHFLDFGDISYWDSTFPTTFPGLSFSQDFFGHTVWAHSWNLKPSWQPTTLVLLLTSCTELALKMILLLFFLPHILRWHFPSFNMAYADYKPTKQNSCCPQHWLTMLTGISLTPP